MLTIETACPLTEDYSQCPDGMDILEAFESINWSQLSAIKVTRASGDFLDLSGSKEDGFSAIYRAGVEEYISSPGPEGLEDMRKMAVAYAAGDGAWKEVVAWQFFRSEAAPTEPRRKRLRPVRIAYYLFTILLAIWLAREFLSLAPS